MPAALVRRPSTLPLALSVSQPTNDATRRQFLGLLAAAGLLTACGSDDDAPTGGQTARSTRSIDHTAGATEVPVDPQRVVALDEIIALGLIALGLPPVAAGTGIAEFTEAVSELLPDGLDIANTATTEDFEVNVEAIAALGPDLVLGTDLDEESFGQLAALAPTVLVERGTNSQWRERFLAVADAVNRAEQGAEVEAAYERQLAELPDAVRGPTVAFARPNADGTFVLDGGSAGFAGSVAADVGITALRAPDSVGVQDEDSGFVDVSGERLDVLQGADLIVLPSVRGGEDSIALFEANPLWAGLPAVDAGRVVGVPNLVYNGGTHYAAELLLSAIQDALNP